MVPASICINCYIRTFVWSKFSLSRLLMVCMFVFLWGECVHVHLGAHGGQKRVSDSLELELQAILSHLTWVLGIKFQSPEKAVDSLNPWAFSPFPHVYSWHLQCTSWVLLTYSMASLCSSSPSVLITKLAIQPLTWSILVFMCTSYTNSHSLSENFCGPMIVGSYVC